MTAITNLPRRPLEAPDIAKLGSKPQVDVVPYGGLGDDENIEIYAIKLAVNDTAYALGFDDDASEWTHIMTVDAADRQSADEQLDSALDAWAIQHYSENFDVVKPL